MALTFCCGMECGVFGTVGQHWNALGTNIPVINTTGSFLRSGARSVRFNNTANHGILRNNYDSSAVYVARFYVYFSSLPNGNCSIFFCINGTAYPFLGAMFKSSDNSIYAGSNTALNTYSFGSSGVAVTTGQWYRIDCAVNVSANPWTVDVKVNGTSCGQYTDAQTASTFTNVNLGSEDDTTCDMYMDDFALSLTAGDYPIGAGYVNHFVPTADGTHNVAGTNDFERSGTGTDILNSTTDAYLLIDDVPLESGSPTDYINLIAPPNATDYVECIFGPAPGISTPTAAPRSVEVIVAAAAASAVSNNLRVAINDNGTTDDVRNATVGSTTCVYSRKHYSDPPSAASAWTLSGNGNFNNLRMRCYTSDANPDPYLVSIMVEAEFQQFEVTIPNKIYKVNQAVKRSATW